MTFLKIDNLVKRYEDYEALNIDNISIKEGEMIGLLGPNGAGKSTLISILTGLDTQDSGSVFYNGEEKIPKESIGYVPQDIALYEELNAIDNLTFFGSMYVNDRNKVKRKVKEIITMVGLESKSRKAIKTYSGGMKRRINIGAALVHDPQILFFDEPTVGIDPQSRNYIYEIINNLKDAGKTLVYTTHYMDEVEKLCDSVYIIDEGKVILKGKTKELLQSLGKGILELTVKNSAINDKIPSIVEEISEVKFLKARNETYYFSIHGSIEKVTKKLFDKTSQNEIMIESLNYSSPNLDTLFLILTGKELREG
ncbi:MULTISPECIES: ABC transporter ATP-binding protein [Bacillus]|uniref:ABC transporter ATP-binding protein n=1 Tax=Bacillus TaxID=1386 RepID=UPI00285EA0C7|nr:ABC transporter ATP-binding protein [Bacillus pumilus]MDR7250857.1 ABC-2 type transport system ATP-binding protein [Bacillus pumilus]